MSTATYEVEGLTCGACIGEVLGKVLDLAGVDEATMDRTADAYSLTVVGACPGHRGCARGAASRGLHRDSA